jgi:hypothetical protein
VTNTPERRTLESLPPKRASVRAHYETHAAWMREDPDTWYFITRAKGYSTASNMNAGQYTAFPRGEFRFESRRNAEGAIEVWGKVRDV